MPNVPPAQQFKKKINDYIKANKVYIVLSRSLSLGAVCINSFSSGLSVEARPQGARVASKEGTSCLGRETGN
jgi:hypothetical protein